MKLIIGLGNPGEKYASTRHNLGFMVVENFIKDFGGANNTKWEDNKKFKSEIAEFNWQAKDGKAEKIIVAKPQTFMNNSGTAVGILAEFYKINPTDIWIIHDEIDLPTGTLKVRFGGGSAGHHGIESIMSAIGTEKFWRFRLGIGILRHSEDRSSEESTRHALGGEKLKHVEEFVVGKFSRGEQGKIRELIKRATDAVEMALVKDLKSAANRYNTK